MATLPASSGGWMVAMSVADLPDVAIARRLLRQQLLDDAGMVAVPAGYVCNCWVGLTEIRTEAEVIRGTRGQFTSAAPFDHLEMLLSEATAIAASGRPVLLMGVLPVTADPISATSQPA